MKIIYEDNHLLVVEKEPNILTQGDQTGDLDLLTIAQNYIKVKYQKPGNVFLGLVHRLDRPVGGIVVFAKTSKAASRLSNQIRLNQWTKIYHAVVEGHVIPATWTDYLYKNNKTNTSYVVDKNKGKYSELIVLESESLPNNQSLIKINLVTGRSHQIRVQCASRNHPIVNDQRYHPNPEKNQQIKLLASGLTIIHPTKREELTFSLEVKERLFK